MRFVEQLTLGLAAGAALLAAYAAFGRSSPPTPAPCPCGSGATAVEAAPAKGAERSPGGAAAVAVAPTSLARLEEMGRRLDALERRAPASASGGAGVAPPATAAETAPRYVRFDTGGAPVSIKQEESGALSVTTKDPSLAGKTLVVRAFAADGTESQMTVTVPPP